MAPRNGGPNDPDNPSAPRNRPTSPAPSQPPRPTSNVPGGPRYDPKPGLEPGGSTDAYDDWWYANGYEVSQWMFANPDDADWIKSMSWTYRDNKDALIDGFMGRGLNAPGKSPGGGRGPGGGGGGGGGVTKDQQYQQAYAAIKNQAAQLGLDLDDDGITALARVVVDANWSNDMVTDYLAPGAKDTTRPGQITDNVDTIKKLAADQLLNVSDASAREWSVKIASGEMTFEAVRSLMAQQATVRYGWAASQIGQGITVRDMMLPNRDKLAAELELNADDVDLMDAKWLGMLQTKNEDGSIRAATDGEIAERARQDARWQKTQAAKTAVTNMSSMLSKTFGF